MSDLVMLAASLLATALSEGAESTQPLAVQSRAGGRNDGAIAPQTTGITVSRPEAIAPERSTHPRYRRPIAQPTPRPPIANDLLPMAFRGDADVVLPELAYQDLLPLPTPRPGSGSQLYQQRQMALQAGKTYTRLPTSSFYESWVNANAQPTHEQWIDLLAQEARSMAYGQGHNRLSILVGDSISQWYPPERLSGDRFWLNQGISGDTTSGVLQRLSAFENTRPDTIHVMVGINDLRRGESDATVLGNLQQIAQQLRQQHPQSRVVLYSILPTRLPELSSDRIRQLNTNLRAIAQQENAQFMDLQTFFTDHQDNLRPDLTTDGLHLNPSGYAVWHWALQQFV
ncbi:MAG: lysophospholipase [Kaiparowitsia implicata GSE-PSE-MK54-09C]|nr:lysophospholipase [Kaiparowitsia implicata GSE-PSE-MK54-09C]